ncbi:Putative multidrug resistance efflux transporter [Eubacterium aggregans]|uniref:Putative multidrug resistance efflux transporter n=1 Tax=Eubacterium aggregans TaxID=81409 RepID=A0A1H4CFM8_9FIRM|nr:Putative multidrug resistance efflux transporter [Eubacterium aggregans]
MEDITIQKALIYGILGSFFFAFTFIFNRSMNLAGGYWLWSAVLRYVYTLPILFLILWKQGGLYPVWTAVKKKPGSWLLWSTVGFGLFYLPLTLASVYGASWFVAASWQLTIVCGVLLTPLFGKRIPGIQLACSGIILLGVFLLQWEHLATTSLSDVLLALVCIVLAAFAYPLGNRKMMVICTAEHLTTLGRVFGMTLCSMPFWLLAGGYAVMAAGPPSAGQQFQSFIVALFSGIVATLLFFKATDLVKHNHRQLAVIEATQSGEVVFTLLGGILWLGDPMPSPTGFLGLAIIIGGMIASSLTAKSD